MRYATIVVVGSYRSRTYGATNIRRARDGFKLLHMALTGCVRFRLGGRA